jgi:hypothetical protein
MPTKRPADSTFDNGALKDLSGKNGSACSEARGNAILEDVKVTEMGQVGVIYVAFGAPYLAMSLVSIASLRVSNPFTPVCVVTNVCEKPRKTSFSILEKN